jgi:hypothetical protein
MRIRGLWIGTVPHEVQIGMVEPSLRFMKDS